MTNTTKRNKRVLLTVIACAAALTAFLPLKARVQDGWRIADLPPLADQAHPVHPKLDGALNRVYNLYLAKGLSGAKELVAQRGMIDLEGDMVRAVAVGRTRGLRTGDFGAAQIKSGILRLGGRVETSYHELVQCLIPINTLAAIADLPDITLLRLPLKPRPLTVTSEGVAKTGADTWQSVNPYRTPGEVKVCVLDLAFKDYRSLASAGELPGNVTARSFRSDGLIEGPSSWDNETRVHGAACAEIVYDMAPDAKLYLVNFNTDVEHHNAVDWLINTAKVNVISYSVGWTNAGDGKGTGPINEDVKRASQAGIIWVGAAGNYAEDHWEGTFNDTDLDGWHNFLGSDEILSWYVPADTYVAAWLSWDDFGTWSGTDYSGSNQNYDLYLYIWTGSNWSDVPIDKSEFIQNGPGDWPTEAVGFGPSSLSTYWGIAIKKTSATRNCKLDLFTYGNTNAIEYNVPAGSLCSPADSAECVTVGATDWSTDAYHSYSSRGPTNDNRIKPDFSAPSRVSTKSYIDLGYWFSGTSSSTPHVAGAFALLKGNLPYSLTQINTILQGRALDLGTAGKDNQFGVGRLKLTK
jgi:hypothetical protein